MNTKLTSWMVVVIFLSKEINCDDSLQNLHEKLVEITTVDERGVVRARVVAQTLPTTNSKASKLELQPTSYPIDDEDSAVSSGDLSEVSDFVAHDEPVPALGQATASISLLNSITPSSTSTVIVTVRSKANESTVVPSMSTSNISVTLRPSNVVEMIPSTKLKGATINITRAVTTSFITASSTTVLSYPEVKTDSTTTSKPSTIVSIPTTNVTEIKSAVTPTAPTTKLETTTKPTKADHEDESTAAMPTEIISPEQSTLKPTLVVKAHEDPSEKPRKTLFGFVTVEILIALLAGALFSVLLVAFLVYRLKKRNEGSYELSETIALRPKELDEMGTKKEVFV